MVAVLHLVDSMGGDGLVFGCALLVSGGTVECCVDVATDGLASSLQAVSIGQCTHGIG